VVNVVVGGERVANLAEGYARLPEVRLHGSKGPWPAHINEQARGAGAYNPVTWLNGNQR
jgi:hypothetical protein